LQSTQTLIMAPGDGRKERWIDPRKLCRLHNQTVELSVEETTDAFDVAPDMP
jgi:hypothetical protein